MKKAFLIGHGNMEIDKFISLLKEKKITKLIDIRLNRDSQLSGFAKGRDLKYLLEKVLNIKYEVIEDFAPTKELLKEYQEHKDWNKYEIEFKKIIKERKLERFKDKILDKQQKICFLCSESEPDKCHRRLISEFFKFLNNSISIKHL